MDATSTKNEARYVLQVSAGASGPLEARAFAARLAEALAHVCRARGLAVEHATHRDGDASAPRSVELVVRGDAAPVVLAGELGTHALLARSDRRGRAARKRWFAVVALHARPAATGSRAVDPRELEVTAVRASGPGGQHVNKVSTAVRVRHVPTGLTVRAADERSQRSNLRRAIERLEARMAARDAQAGRAAGAAKRAAHGRIERGGGAAVRTWREGRRGALEAADGGDTGDGA